MARTRDETPESGSGIETRTVDPVCGMEVDPREAFGPIQFRAESFYFCSEECQREFESAPEAYAELDRRPAPPLI